MIRALAGQRSIGSTARFHLAIAPPRIKGALQRD